MASKRTKRQRWTQDQTETFLNLIKLNKDRLNNKHNESTIGGWTDILNDMKMMYGDVFAEMNTDKLKAKWRKLKDVQNRQKRQAKSSLISDNSLTWDGTNIYKKRITEIEKRFRNTENVDICDNS